MLKISKDRKEGQSITLRLEGRVVGPWVGELRQVCDHLLVDDTTLSLDLTDVSFADEPGLATLASLRRRGVKLLHPSPFVSEQLKAVNLEAAKS